MTLQTLLYNISEVAIAQKIIQYAAAGTDIYSINFNTIKDYPVLFTTPTGSQRVKENTTEYNLTLYYLERLLSDNSNDIDIISHGMEELKNLIKGIEGIVGVVGVAVEYDIIPFTETEAFNDRLAGDYVTIRIEVMNDNKCFEG